MSAIAEIARAICYVAIACAVIDVLAPDGKLRKVFSIIVGAFIILTVISGVSQDLDLSDLLPEPAPARMEIERGGEEFAAAVQEQTTELVRDRLAEHIDGAVLSRVSVKAKKISIYMDISEDGGISMKCIEITLDSADADKAYIVTAELVREFGNDVEIAVKLKEG